MWRLAIRQILYNRVRSSLTLLAISAAIVVILVLRGFEQGLYEQSKNAVLNRGGELILTQSGISNFLAVRSSIPQLARARVEEIDGVKIAHPMTGLWVIYGPEGNKFPLFLLVYDTLGGATSLVEGRNIQNGREIIVDRGLSKRFGLKLNDSLVISDFEFQIVGITNGSSALFSTFAYVNYDGLIDLFLESEIAPDISTFPLLSFLLVELSDNADLDAVINNIELNVPSVDVFTPQQLAANDVKLGEELFGSIIGVLVTLSYIIGLLVIGLIIYSDVSSRQRSFGVMKALGFRMSHIVKQVSLQTGILVIIAFPLGVLFAYLLAEFIEWNMPVYQVYILEPHGLLRAALGIMVITFIGSLLPLRIISRSDPMLAFQVE